MKSWKEFLDQESKQDYFVSLMQKVDEAYDTGTVYPSRDEMFSCFDLCPYEDVKVVIIGQDPYHGAGQAHGLSFSVKPGIKVPPSLKNIYKELKTDLGIDAPNHGYLTSWAKQGVLMMNTSWSVTEGKAGSHKSFGWKKFTQRVLDVLNDYDKPIVFILWGNHAIDAAKGVTNTKHCLLKGIHPSPLAGGGFFGSKPFSQTNQFLKKAGRGTIDWRIADEEQPQNITTKPTSKKKEVTPTFTKIWENTKISDKEIEVDTSNDFLVKEIEGDILQILDLKGKQVLVIENKNKLQLIDSLSFVAIDKPITLAPIKASVSNIQLIKVDNKWCVVYASDHSQVVIYNLETKKKSILCKSEDWISNLFVFEINGMAFALVIANQGNTVFKYNLNTQTEELQFNTGCHSAYFKFYLLNNDQPTLLLYQSESGNRLYQLIDANTGTQISETISLEGEGDAVKDQAIVKVDDDKYILAIAKKQHLLLFDIVTSKQTHNILIDEDSQYSVGWSNALTTYHSKLIIGSKQEVKVFDLNFPDQAPLSFKYTDDQKVGYFDQLVQGHYQGKDILIAECSMHNDEGQTIRPSLMFDLETLKEVSDVHIIGDLAPSNMSFKIRNILSFIDQEGRELFFSKYSNDNDSSTILWNPKGCIPEQVETIDYLKLISTIVDSQEIIIAQKSNNQLCLIDSNSGLELNSLQLSGYVSHIKVEEIAGKQQLLVLADNKIQAYNLPDFSPTNIIIDDMLGYSFFDIYDEKIVAGSESDIYTWRLDNLDTPEKLIVVDEDEAEISAISRITTIKLHDQDYLFISNYESFTYLYNPETNKVSEFDVDDTMWNVNADDPDYCMYEAVVAKTSKGEQIITASHHGAISIYDPNALKRKGKIMKTRENVYADFLYLSRVNDVQYLVTPEGYSVIVWDIDSRKKIKEFYFEEPVTSITTCGNKIIIAYGENLQTVEVTH